MVLSDSKILEEIEKGSILIEPFDPNALGTNSYDVHLGRHIALYKNEVLDAKQHNEIDTFEIPDDGVVLHPGKIYLGVTKEYTETLEHVAFLEGLSSVGRLGISINANSRAGDVGFCNTWTLEITVAQPVKIYKGMPIGQLFYLSVEGDISNYYHVKKDAKYINRSMKPVESMMYKNKF
ncbi:dCTP deaminase [Flammeovirga kamogawensis]|uniref:dCTP deaminase n=1 Tax=Flammeovirga kamogawensis TaxID=373891 RepID=A0ABX8GY04_9BACT|nr:dCTP deaminase [Flammeovirga kamogawensis]MBB6458927.1 dCTP deaminase [Flammeovirga kamogawensis]QWG08503.1 dCTP deaminase [Flammeovirga kamogawensis]TRX66796.1 dCTP deaminase [Flammeovirga kamogawensis]